MPATLEAGPFSDLIGGEGDAPAYQRDSSGSLSEVPRAQLSALPAPDVPDAFSDLQPESNSGDPGPFADLLKPQSETEKAMAETPTFNPLDEQVSAAPTFMGELAEGRIGSAYHIAKESVARALEPAQQIEPGRGKGLLGTEEQMQDAVINPDDPTEIAAAKSLYNSTPLRTARAFINVVNRTAANLTGPGMLPLAVIGGAGGATGRILASAFGADMASNAPEVWKAIQEADKTEPWSQKRLETGFDTVMQAIMLHGALKHAATGEAVGHFSEPEAVAATTERPAEQTQQSAPPAPAPAPAAPEARPEQRMVPVEELPKTQGEPDAVQIRSPESEIPRTIETWQDQPGSGGETRPGEPGASSEASRAEVPIEEPQTVAEPEGNDWTGATPESKFKLGGKSEGGFVIGGEALDKAAEAIERGKVAAGLRISGKANDLNAATTARSAKLQTSFADSERAQHEINQTAKTERARNAMSVFIEAKGDANTLKTWESSAKGKVFKRAAADAQALKPEEIAMAKKVGQTFAVLEKRGNTYDVLKGHKDNYVPHVWDVTKKFTGIGSSKLQDRFKFNKARSFETFFDGDQAGFKPKTLDIGKLLPAYLHEMNRVIADRQFVQDVSKGRSTEGTPLVIPRGKVSGIDTAEGGKAFLADPNAIHGMKDAAGNPIDQSQYKTVDQPALSDWRWANKDTNGNPIFMKDDLAVHPELAKRLNSILGQSEIKRWYNEPSSGLSVVPRAIVKALDTTSATMKREMFGLIALFHPVQEGTHGVGHLTNPVGGFEDMSRPTAEHIDAMQHGLMLQPEKQSSAGYMEGLGSQSTFVSQAARKFGGPAGRAIAGVLDGYQKWMFHQYIPALKYSTYKHALARNLSRYAKDLKAGEVTIGDVKMLTAEQMNAAYGHLNLALLDRNPTWQHIIQSIALAPDFFEARARFTGQGIRGLVSKSGREQLRALATLAAIQAGSAFVISKVLGDEWDPKHPFEVTHGGRTYMLRSVPEDIARAFFSGEDKSREFFRARENPLLATAVQLSTGKNYRGEKTGWLDTVGEAMANFVPIVARSLPGIRNLTQTSRNNPVSPWEQFLGSAGIKISRYSPITKTYQLASDWKKSAGLPPDTGSYPVSIYQQLRYALEDGNLDKAKQEYQKLVAAKGGSEKVASGFKESVEHAFTGSKASDIQFKKSLSPENKALFDMAVKRRHDLLIRFGRLRGAQ